MYTRLPGVVILIGLTTLLAVSWFTWDRSTHPDTDSGHPPLTPIPSFEEVVSLPTPTETLSDSRVQLFLVALEDAGQHGILIGCSDSLVGVETDISLQEVDLTDVFAPLLNLSKLPESDDLRLYNALSQSRLQVTTATVTAGVATVGLSGEYQLGGACDNPRFEHQLMATALQFPGVNEVIITINGQTLTEIVSGEGEE